MAFDNTDFDDAFAEASAEVEAGGGVEATQADRKQNAKIHLGDGEVVDPQGSEGDDDDEVALDLDGDDDDESFEDETSDDEDPEGDEDADEAFDWSTVEDKLVTVKVNGTDVSVPLKEALNGYMRQADYTQKTQALSNVRKVAEFGAEMQRALQEDPQEVILSLAQAFQVDLSGGNAPDPYTTDDPELQPVLDELKSTKAQLARLQQESEQRANEAIQASVRAEIATLESTYADFDKQVVIPLALERKLDLESAYFMWKGQQAREAEANRTANTSKVKDTVERTARKRANSAKVSTGARKVTTSTPDPSFDSFEEMLTHELSKTR